MAKYYKKGGAPRIIYLNGKPCRVSDLKSVGKQGKKHQISFFETVDVTSQSLEGTYSIHARKRLYGNRYFKGHNRRLNHLFALVASADFPYCSSVPALTNPPPPPPRKKSKGKK